MQTIVTVKCLDQALQLINAPRIASGGVNDVRAEFEFCPLWADLVKAAVFYTDPKTVYKQILEDDACDVPQEVLAAPGLMYMGVFGVDAAGSIVRTSVILVLTVEEGAITEATAVSDPTPELYQQVLAEVQKAREVAEQISEQQSAFESEVRQAVETVPEQAAAAGTQAAQEAITQLTPTSIGAVDVNPQELTADQQAQARENIDAASKADADGKLPLTGGDMTGWIDFGQATRGLRWKTDDGTVFTFRPYAAGNVLQVTRRMADGSEYGALNIYTNGRVEVEGASDSLERVHNIMVVPAGTDVGNLSLSAGTIVMVRK